LHKYKNNYTLLYIREISRLDLKKIEKLFFSAICNLEYS
jgi:hypothetical protein